MDADLKLLAETLFAGVLSTKDVYVLAREMRGQSPRRTVFSVDAQGCVGVDFEYDGFRASDYLGTPRTALPPAEHRAHAALVARELTAVDMIDEDPAAYMRASPHLRRLMRVARNRKRMAAIARTQQRAARRGLDCAFIKDVVF